LHLGNNCSFLFLLHYFACVALLPDALLNFSDLCKLIIRFMAELCLVKLTGVWPDQTWQEKKPDSGPESLPLQESIF
jgi:hypothetical protein